MVRTPENRLESKSKIEHVQCVVGHRSYEKRPGKNEDRIFQDADRGVFAVMDGMGGHSGGEIASQTAAEALRDQVGHRLTEITFDQEGMEALYELAHDVHDAIKEVAQSDPELSDMGTTLSFVRVGKTAEGIFAAIMHVGDSRVYLIRGGELTQLTRDHARFTLGMSDDEANALTEKLDSATRSSDLTSDERQQFKIRSSLYQAVGGGEAPRPQFQVVRLEEGDRLLLSTDGVHDNLTSEEIQKIVSEAPDVQTASELLAGVAYDRSKDPSHFRSKEDDITNLILEIPSGGGQVVGGDGQGFLARERQKEVVKNWAKVHEGEIARSRSVTDLLEVIRKTKGVPGSRPGVWYSDVDLDERMQEAELSGNFNELPSAGGFRKKFVELMLDKVRSELGDAA